MSAVPQQTSGWTRLIPEMDLLAKPRATFLLFFVCISLATYFLGPVLMTGASGLTLLLVMWFLVPGCLGIGWWVAYRISIQIGTVGTLKRAEQEILQTFHDAAARHGDVKFIDATYRFGGASGLAVAGTSLLVLLDSKLRKVARDEIRSWRREIRQPDLLLRNGKQQLEDSFENDAARREVGLTNGFCIVTHDPNKPELLFRTSDEATCKRWETVLNNILEGRMAID